MIDVTNIVIRKMHQEYIENQKDWIDVLGGNIDKFREVHAAIEFNKADVGIEIVKILPTGDPFDGVTKDGIPVEIKTSIHKNGNGKWSDLTKDKIDLLRSTASLVIFHEMSGLDTTRFTWGNMTPELVDLLASKKSRTPSVTPNRCIKDFGFKTKKLLDIFK